MAPTLLEITTYFSRIITIGINILVAVAITTAAQMRWKPVVFGSQCRLKRRFCVVVVVVLVTGIAGKVEIIQKFTVM